jgi:hypothetical protein
VSRHRASGVRRRLHLALTEPTIAYLTGWRDESDGFKNNRTLGIGEAIEELVAFARSRNLQFREPGVVTIGPVPPRSHGEAIQQPARGAALVGKGARAQGTGDPLSRESGRDFSVAPRPHGGANVV